MREWKERVVGGVGNARRQKGKKNIAMTEDKIRNQYNIKVSRSAQDKHLYAD